MKGTKERAVWIIAALLFVPALVNPAAWPVAVFLAVAWLGATYGLSYVLDLEKVRREGERGMIKETRRRSRGGRDK